MRAAIAAALFAMPAVAAAAPPPCYPFGIKGESQFKAEWLARTNNGWYVFQLCKNAQGLWDGYGLYCRHGICNQPDWLTSQLSIAQAADKVAAADGEWALRVTAADCATEIANNTANAPICRDVRAAMDAAVKVANAAVSPPPPPPPPPPPAEIWRVAPSGNSTTRVVYQVVNGRLGGLTSPLRTVPVGTPCDGAAFRVTQFGITYMAVPGGAAVCSPGAP